MIGFLPLASAYLSVGMINVALGPLMIWDGERGLDGWVELGLYLLLWPLQLLFQTLIWIHAGTGWLLERILP